jgi:hypothetical protein
MEEETCELELRAESDECASAAIKFVNLPIPDCSVPPDRDASLRGVDQLAQRVKEGRFLGAHCRAGIGRSSLLAVSLLVRLGWDASEAFDTVESACGCSIPDTAEHGNGRSRTFPPPATRVTLGSTIYKYSSSGVAQRIFARGNHAATGSMISSTCGRAVFEEKLRSGDSVMAATV